MSGGTATQLAEFADGLTAGTTYDIKIERVDDTIRVYRNGSLAATATDGTWASGKVGFGTKGDAATFDDLKVTQP